MLKGTTRIELTDVRSGKKEVFEDHNFFTNAFRDICQPVFRHGLPFASIVAAHKQTLTTQDFTGGLLLFDSALPDDPNSYFPPVNAEMVGHASDATYSGSDISQGSYNLNQSDVSLRDTKKYVWDFTSEQANGNISAICLTTVPGGKIGYGSKTPPDLVSSGDNMLSCFERARLEVSYPSGDTFGSRRIVYINFKEDYVLALSIASISTGTLRFYKLPIWGDRADIFSRLPSMYYSSMNTKGRFTSYIGDGYTNCEMTDVDLTAVIGTQAPGSNSIGAAQEGKYLYLSRFANSLESSQGSAWAPNTSQQFIKIDLETLAYETFTITNTTGVSLSSRGQSSNIFTKGYNFAVLDGYMFVKEWVQSSGKRLANIYAINIQDNTIVRQINYNDGTPAKAGSTGPSYDTAAFGPTIQGRVHVSPNGDFYGSPESAEHTLAISTSDFIAKSLSCPSASFASPFSAPNAGNPSTGALVPTDNPLYFGSLTLSTSNELILCLMPNVLMTINNLGVPVTKTGAQTMRITYTITKEAPSEPASL